MLLVVVAAFAATDAARAEVQLPEMIRVRLSVSGPNFRATLPDGAQLAIDDVPVSLPNGDATLGIAPDGWRLGIPAESPVALLAVAGAGSDDPVRSAGLFSGRNAAERARRILRAEFGRLPEVSRTGWHISLNASVLRESPARIDLTPGPTAPLTLNGRDYRGQLRLDPAGDGFVVTNVLLLEEYLYSVVGSEMPSTWSLEALKAQAVAARTYALRQISPDADYDICDSTACQAYGGIATETTSVRQAVDATSGIVATYDGQPIDAVYSANMGGQTAAAEDVWANYSPYLRPVASPFDSLALGSGWAADDYEWTVELTPAQLLAGLRRRGYDLTSLEAVSVIADDGFGRAVALEIRGRPFTLTIYRDEIRYALGIKSTVVAVSTTAEKHARAVVGAPGIAAERWPAGAASGGYRRSIAFEETPEDVRLNNGSVFTRELILPESIVLTGRGFGHGVGMSQWGAQGMALDGSDFEAILKHYFTGIELTQAG
ncbi:MAG: SpoIID/LytB domain-containing protein [Chloroflexota bacterium]|nr:SpoIID/LytB domain-containing protein [Chloroflexota bacterium]